MKTIITTVLFTFIFLVSNAQELDPKIKAVYGDKAQELIGNDAIKLKIFNDLITNRIKIVESPVEGKEKCQKLSEMELVTRYNPTLERDKVFDPLTFNALKYRLNFFPNGSRVFYRVDNTNYLIIIEPQSTLKN